MLIRFSPVHFNGDKKRKKIKKTSPDVPSHRAVSKEVKQWTSLVPVKSWSSAGGMAVGTTKGRDGRRGPSWAAGGGTGSVSVERLPPDKPRRTGIPGTSEIWVNYL